MSLKSFLIVVRDILEFLNSKMFITVTVNEMRVNNPLQSLRACYTIENAGASVLY